MQRHSPARVLAPLALIAAATAVFAVVRPSADSGSASPTRPTATQKQPATTKTSAKKPSTAYTVKRGDTLSGIAERTGVPLQQILKLNDVDANSLSVGRRLKLRS